MKLNIINSPAPIKTAFSELPIGQTFVYSDKISYNQSMGEDETIYIKIMSIGGYNAIAIEPSGLTRIATFNETNTWYFFAVELNATAKIGDIINSKS